MDTEKQPTTAVSRAPAVVPATASNVALPAVSEVTGDMLTQITGALGVPRDVVAQDDQIGHAWSQLPRLVRRIPPHLRDERIVRACIAVATGLFDAAINYIWNAAILALREKVRDFGLHVIPQILDDRSFDEASLVDLKDADLLELCHKLNLITGQAYHFLDQCRATRNSYSVAHPSDGTVDEDEVVYFISQCQKYALSNVQHARGVDTKALLGSLSAAKFSANQLNEWETRVRGTFDAQRHLIFGMLHGVYCDPDAGEVARVNALELCKRVQDELTPSAQSVLLDRHQDYRAKGDEKRHRASQQFFQRVGLMALLSEAEVHRLITSASKDLLRVHNGFSNFYNEPPFADRLVQLTRDVGVPRERAADVRGGRGHLRGWKSVRRLQWRRAELPFAGQLVFAPRDQLDAGPPEVPETGRQPHEASCRLQGKLPRAGGSSGSQQRADEFTGRLPALAGVGSSPSA